MWSESRSDPPPSSTPSAHAPAYLYRSWTQPVLTLILSIFVQVGQLYVGGVLRRTHLPAPPLKLMTLHFVHLGCRLCRLSVCLIRCRWASYMCGAWITPSSSTLQSWESAPALMWLYTQPMCIPNAGGATSGLLIHAPAAPSDGFRYQHARSVTACK